VSGEFSADDLLTFTPDLDYAGDEVVTLHLLDSQGGEATQTLTLTWTDNSEITIDIPLSTGWNLVSLPLEADPVYAEDLCTEVGGQLTEVDRWYVGGWDPHICGLSFNNFLLDIGNGYFGRMDAAGTWSVTGTELQTDLVIDLYTGWNLISVPSGFAYLAEELGLEINNQGGTCSEIDRWYVGGWDPHIIGLSFNNFNIEPGQGYFVRCDAESSLTLSP